MFICCLLSLISVSANLENQNVGRSQRQNKTPNKNQTFLINLQMFTLLQTVNLLSATLEAPCEIHRPQTASERRDIDPPMRKSSVMRYEADTVRGDEIEGCTNVFCHFPHHLPLPGVLQITSPGPAALASHWPRPALFTQCGLSDWPRGDNGMCKQPRGSGQPTDTAVPLLER